jgi:hypothetical protein
MPVVTVMATATVTVAVMITITAVMVRTSKAGDREPLSEEAE